MIEEAVLAQLAFAKQFNPVVGRQVFDLVREPVDDVVLPVPFHDIRDEVSMVLLEMAIVTIP